MIWHIVRCDFSSVDAATRDDLEAQLRALSAIDEVAWLHVARDIADDDVTGLLTAFATRDDLERYRDHPEHTPVVARLREAGVGLSRLDVETDGSGPSEPQEAG